MSDRHDAVRVTNQRLMQELRDQMYAIIFPNTPRTDDEKDAFERAITYQYQHMESKAEKMSEIPDGVKSFSIGEFSMTFEDGMRGNRLTMKTLCPSAYGLLLRAGLLYRGVGGGCGCGAD